MSKLPDNLRVRRIIKHMSQKTDQREFTVLFYLDKNTKKALNSTVDHLKAADGGYEETRDLLNLLRQLNATDLIEEALDKASKKQKNNQKFFKQIKDAQNISESLKNITDPEQLDQFLKNNIEQFQDNEIIYDNLKDIFEHDHELNDKKEQFNTFSRESLGKEIDQIETPQEESQAEQSKKVTEIGQALIYLFHSMQVSKSKTDLLKYIKNHESSLYNIMDLKALFAAAQNYRNVYLPKKWKEFKVMNEGKHDLEFYQLWLKTMKSGKNRILPNSIKEHIVKSLILQLAAFINTTVKIIDKKVYFDLKNELSQKELEPQSLQIKTNQFLENPEITAKANKDVMTITKDFFEYLKLLVEESSLEISFIAEQVSLLREQEELSGKISTINSITEKILPKTDHPEIKKNLQNISNRWITVYRLLGGEEINTDDEKSNQDNEIINDLIDEINETGKISGLGKKFVSISEQAKMEVISALSFNPRFDSHQEAISEALEHMKGGKVIRYFIDQAKQIEKKYGMNASEQFLEDCEKRITAQMGNNHFLLYQLKNFKDNLRKRHNEDRKSVHFIKDELDSCSSIAEKLVMLKRLAEDPEYKSLHGAINRMEQVLIRKDISLLFKELKDLPIETKKNILVMLYHDLKNMAGTDISAITRVAKEIKLLNAILNKMDFYKSEEDRQELENIIAAEFPTSKVAQKKQEEEAKKQNNENQTDTVNEISDKEVDLDLISGKPKKVIKEQVELMRRIEKEIDHLPTDKHKIAKLLEWKTKEYHREDQIHIREYIDKQILQL
ncbi:MAG: hypothetical protein MJB14_17870 [Spirochaetes bacterium]|nr:hypothetical protein [Spirochaetota bacterium]